MSKHLPAQMPIQEWQRFLEAVPDDQRQAIAKMLRRHQLTTYDGFINFCTDVMAEVLSGGIPPAVADAAVRWAELAFTALAVATDRYQVSPQQTQMNILAVLNQAMTAAPRAIAAPSYEGIEAGVPEVMVISGSNDMED